MTGHVCSESRNPRHAGYCDCGKRLSVSDPQPAGGLGPLVRPRNLQSERQWLREAARGIADPEAAIAHAELRAAKLSGEYVQDAMTVRLDKDRPKEGCEEAIDGINHVRWWLEDNVGHPLAKRRFRAMQLFLLAYEELRAEEP